MTATRPPGTWPPPPGLDPERTFQPDQCDGMPAAAVSFLRHAIAPGARLGARARIAMHGTIKIGGGWIPFRANELIDTRVGFWWDASVAGGLLTASDRYAYRTGSTRIDIVGLIPLKVASNSHTSKSALGRFIAEQAVFMPGSLLSDPGVDWTGSDAEHATVTTSRDGEHAQLSLHVTAGGQLLDLTTLRWGAVGRGRYHYLPFGIEAIDERTFGDFTVASSFRAGWWYATPRWRRGEFFRCTVDELDIF